MPTSSPRSCVQRPPVRLWILALAVLSLLPVAAATAQPAPEPIRVRHSAGTLTATQIASLRKGVKAMKARPASDPTSWLYQANMHGTFDTPVKTAWNSCQHGSFFFLSWHRMYLYYFERILRKASGDSKLTLPYWNYSDPTQRAIPLPYRSPASTATNPLFVSQRAPGINSGALLPASAVSFSAAFAFTNFSSPAGSGLSFGGPVRTTPAHGGSPAGSLEGTPHGTVHVAVGGATGLMSAFETAARDPIFWAHHANIDRLWNRWLQQGGGRKNPTSNAAWMTTKFTFFDENGHQIQMTGAQVLTTASQLRYRYDDDPPTLVFPTAVTQEVTRPHELMAEAGAAVEIGAARSKVTVSIPAEKRAKVAAAFGEVPQVALTLALENITLDKQPGVFYEVYVNLPDDVQDPDPQSASYVGNLSFFGFGGAPHAGMEGMESNPTFNFDLTGAARALKEEGQWKDEAVTLTLVPRGLQAPAGKPAIKLEVAGKVKIGKVSVATD